LTGWGWGEFLNPEKNSKKIAKFPALKREKILSPSQAEIYEF
jgi:hypothetical protein